MTDLRRPLDDDALGAALRDLGDTLAWPSSGGPGRDVASRVRVAIVAGAPAAERRHMVPAWPRWRRPLLLALAALLLLAAVAGAAMLGLPGIRLVLGPGAASPSLPPTPAPSATAPAGPIGTGLGLGQIVSLDELEAAAGRPVAFPTDPLLGPPDTAWVDRLRNRQVALVWAARPDLPATLDPGVGLVLMSFDGVVGEPLYAKLMDMGTSLEPVTVGGDPGFWIGDAPHFFVYEGSGGGIVEDPRRWVGDALIWSDGTTTWRIESALGREATIRIAESLASAAGSTGSADRLEIAVVALSVGLRHASAMDPS